MRSSDSLWERAELHQRTIRLIVIRTRGRSEINFRVVDRDRLLWLPQLPAKRCALY
jgi:hypothetical protein